MKKLFSLLAVAVLGFTACQTDEGVKNATLENEGVVSLNVSVPELATRALDGDNQYGADSAYGAIDYANYTSFLESEYDVRFQLAVYEAGAAEDAEPIYTATNYVDFASTTNFNDLRFVPGREYQFVLFADFVKQGTQEDFRYNTADLRNITSFEALNAMDETYDAYFFNTTLKVEAGKINELEAVLKRPFGKIRVLTTDLAFVEKYAMPAEGEVTFYNHAIYKSFNAVTGEVATEATNAEETISYDIDHAYYGATQYEGKEAATLFATYILGKDAQESVNFRLDTFEEDGSLIKSLDFNTEIPYQRNHLTTLVGNLLTNEADLFVRIDDNFDAEEFIKGDFENIENGLGYVREGVHVAGQIYEYETNLFTFQLLSETDGTALRAGTYEYTEEVAYLQNATGFRVNGIDVEKGTLTVTDRGTRAGNYYDVVFDIYATINGKTENYILTWNGELKAARTQLAEPVVSYEVDEVDALYITFYWDAVEGAKNYTVKWNGEEQTVEGTSATFDFSGENTYATAYVTANPELTWSYTASTGSVTVDWKKPITYTEVEVFLQYVKENEVAFYNDYYTVYFENYPSLEGAWYQVAGQIPTPFSKEANVVEATGSAAQVAIFEPATATCFLYKGALGTPYVLTEAEVKWTDGANTVAVAFSNEAGDAITMHTAVPLAEGRFDIEPSYVAIGGDQAANIEKTEMNVLLDNGVYTVFFNVHSAINDILMVYTGAIDFEKPYAPQYVLTSYTAGAETINFVSDNAEFEIEATSLESGDVVVKKIILDGSDDYAASNQVTAATAVVKEENGEYDARYTVTVELPIVGKKTFDLQYVGPFVPYSAVEPEQVTDFDATYENVEGLAVFTGISHEYKIFVNNLTTIEYDGTQADGWGARSLKFPAGEGFYRFNHGDKLTVDGDDVTLEFVGWNGSKMRMHASTAPAVQEPEEIRVKLALENGLYVGGNYKIDYQQTGTVVYVTNHMNGNLPAMIDQVAVYNDGDELVFEFEDTFNNVKVEAFYTTNVVDPKQDLKIELQFDGTLYTYTFENGYKYVFDTAEGKVGYVAPNGWVPEATFDYTLVESATVDTYTFEDTLNGYNVIATYTKGETLVADLELKSWKQGADVGDNGIQFNAYVENMDDNYVTVVVNSVDATGNSLAEGVYTHSYQYPQKDAGMFTLSAYKFNGVRVTRNNIAEAQMIVVKNGENYDITVVAGEFVAHYFGTVGEATVEPEQPGTGEPEEPTYEELNLKATYNGIYYAAGEYILAEGQWRNTTLNKMGEYETTETDNGAVFTFVDTNYTPNRKVTVTYSTVVDLTDWAFSASLDNGLLTLTGEDGTIVTAKLQGKYGLSTGTYYFNNPGVLNASDATFNGVAAEADGTIVYNDNTYTVTLNMTVNGIKITGTSKNSL